MLNKIGFMQGRLSPLVDEKIQAFPVNHWESEFPAAKDIDLKAMEWTLDQENLHQNPLMTSNGRAQIQSLMRHYNISIPSLTADCCMQFPFFKRGYDRRLLLDDLDAILRSSSSTMTQPRLTP